MRGNTDDIMYTTREFGLNYYRLHLKRSDYTKVE